MYPEDGDLVTTDEAILSSIGEGDESNTGDDTTEEGTGTTTDTGTETSEASDQQDIDGSPGPEQPAKTAGPQDIVDRDGNIVAAGGKERRFYEAARREKTRADSATREAETVRSQLEAITAAGNVGTQYNLTPDELTTGAQLISAYKNNPVETIQYMLTQAQGSGHNVDAIVSGGGTDMNAVKQMLDNALAPLVGDRQQQLDTQAAQSRATEIYNKFSGDHPDAAIHENSLARLLQEDNSLSPEAAYYKLQNFYLQRGLDWTKPIEVLQQQAEAAKTNGVTTPPQPPDGGVSQGNVTDTARVADVNTSTDDIIRQAMAEAGITD